MKRFLFLILLFPSVCFGLRPPDGPSASSANTWTGLQTFSGGVSGNGSGLTNLKFAQKAEWHNADFILTSTAAWYTATSTHPCYGRSKFDGSVSTATNIAYLHFFSGSDWDTTVTPTCYFQDFQGGVDTSSRAYIVGISSVTDDQDLQTQPTQGSLVRVQITNGASGSLGRAGLSSQTTLTGWGTAITANKHYIISIAREGNNAPTDTSSTDSYFGNFVLLYNVAQ